MPDIISQTRAQYKIDIVFCIDCTGSMSPIINEVKAKAIALPGDIVRRFEIGNKPIEQLRIKVIPFGDFATEGDEAITESSFIMLPEDTATFEAAVNSISLTDAGGYGKGGDAPENALEALYKAMQSDWVTISAAEKGRHIIVMLTDALPLHLQERDGSVGYDGDDYPNDLVEMAQIWATDSSQSHSSKLNFKGERLILFAPDGTDENGHSWDDIRGWRKTLSNNVTADNGLNGIKFDDIIEEIFKSV